VDIDGRKEQHRAVLVQVAQHETAIHVAHDVLDAGEGQICIRRIVHDQHDAGDDLQDQTEHQDDAPDPHPVQVLGGRDHDRVIDQTDDGQTTINPLLGTSRRRVMVVRNTGH
jgi:hypothetical protein